VNYWKKQRPYKAEAEAGAIRPRPQVRPLKKKEPESLYLGQEFKKRNFPTTAKEIDMKWKEAPLFEAQAKAEAKGKQLTLFEKGENDHEDK
jgi:hypothetical protein